MSINLSEYICGNTSVCREKRQLTAYLYEIVEKCGRVRIDMDGFANKNFEVAGAFYEPAFLRDYFNAAKNKAAFNLNLLSYAGEKLTAWVKGTETHPDVKVEKLTKKAIEALSGTEEIFSLGIGLPGEDAEGDFGKHINGWSKPERIYRNPVARWMMNTKPDVALLLKRKGVKRPSYRLFMIECNYLSGEEVYPAYVGVYDKTGEKLKECYHIICGKQAICDAVLGFMGREDAEDVAMTYAAEGEETPVYVSSGCTGILNFSGAQSGYAEGLSVEALDNYHRKLIAGEKVKEPKLLLGEKAVLTI